MTGEKEYTITAINDRATYRDDERQVLEVLAETVETDVRLWIAER